MNTKECPRGPLEPVVRGQLAAYHARALEQAEQWVNGLSRHNMIDDECCPDFSCCEPSLFTKDRGERMATANALRARYRIAARHDT